MAMVRAIRTVLRPTRTERAALATATFLLLAVATVLAAAAALAAPQPTSHHDAGLHSRRLLEPIDDLNLEAGAAQASQGPGTGAGGQGILPRGLQSEAETREHREAVAASPTTVGQLYHTTEGRMLTAEAPAETVDTPGGAGGAARLQQQMPEPDGVSCKVSPVKKVALMFLTLGPMPHERLWKGWFQAAEGLLPLTSTLDHGAFCLKTCLHGQCTVECGEAAACSPQCSSELTTMFGLGDGASNGSSSSSRFDSSISGGSGNVTNALLRRQQLFSVYTHAPPEFGSYPPGSPFEGTIIQNRVATAWGSPSLMLAERQLLEAAFADPQNEWFLLLSDTTVPLYPPGLLWQHLMHSNKSKINACQKVAFDQQKGRYSRLMMSTAFRLRHWRKSSQWWMLMRRHVEAVIADTEVHDAFLKHCYIGYDKMLRRERECVSDEHLVPSLLASRGEDNSTTCDGDGATYMDWTAGGQHPKTFLPEEVTAELFNNMRAYKAPKCGSGWWPALEAAARSFVPATELAAPTTCSKALRAGAVAVAVSKGGDPFVAALLPEQCSLMARKFGPEAAPAVLQLYSNCSQVLGVLPCRRGEALQPEGSPARAAASGAGGAAPVASSAGEAAAAASTPVGTSSRVNLWQQQLDAQELAPRY